MSSKSTPAPSIVAGTAVARVGEHRHLLVERLDERHAEALVLARAQEQVGHLVVGDELRVRDVADEVDVANAQLLDEVVQRRQVALEQAEDADDQQAGARVELSPGRRGSSG